LAAIKEAKANGFESNHHQQRTSEVTTTLCSNEKLYAKKVYDVPYNVVDEKSAVANAFGANLAHNLNTAAFPV